MALSSLIIALNEMRAQSSVISLGDDSLIITLLECQVANDVGALEWSPASQLIL